MRIISFSLLYFESSFKISESREGIYIYMKSNILININKVKVRSLSCVQLLRSHGLTIAYQAPPSMGFSRQEYWNGLPFHMQIYSFTYNTYAQTYAYPYTCIQWILNSLRGLYFHILKNQLFLILYCNHCL